MSTEFARRNVCSTGNQKPLGPSSAGRVRKGRCSGTIVQDIPSKCFHHPFQSLEEIRAEQFERVRYLVDLAYREIPVYTEKYQAVGFQPGDLRSWQDFERLPVITKDELVDAFPDRCVTRRWPIETCSPLGRRDLPGRPC